MRNIDPRAVVVVVVPAGAVCLQAAQRFSFAGQQAMLHFKRCL